MYNARNRKNATLSIFSVIEEEVLVDSKGASISSFMLSFCTTVRYVFEFFPRCTSKTIANSIVVPITKSNEISI